ncbi:MAG: hypothetical protein RLZZ298_2185 [Pseudomonadota bacterium]|jgi:asparagine N-glycosylation enzyme membrane subunit Stt3
MKLGPMEGTPEEIKGFIQDNGLQVEKFFQAHEEPISTIWFVVPAVIVITSIAFFTLLTMPKSGTSTFVFLAGCAAALWLATNIQLRFKNIRASRGVLICCVLFLLVALGVINPSDLLAEARKWKN